MRSAMAGQKIRFGAKVRSAVDIWRCYRRGEMGDAQGDLSYHEWLCHRFEELLERPLDGARLVEIGCGQLAKQVALFRAKRAEILGIDMEVPTYELTPSILLDVLRTNGTERALKSLVRHVLYDRRTMGAIRDGGDGDVRFKDLDILVGDAASSGLPSASVDFVFSRSVFEHIEDVPAATREVNRILAPGGAAVIATHLFPSLSGGHNLAWLNPNRSPSETVPAWDHLRENRFPVNTYLNRLRISDYRRIFSAELNVVHEELRTEGERLLTPELWNELEPKGFTREDLFTRNLIITARKRT